MRNKGENKKIGIIGGVGPQATGVLYSQIIRLAADMYGASNNNDFPYVVIESVPIPDFISDVRQLQTAKKMLQKSVKNLEAVGATVLAIASNTVHLLLNDLKKTTNLPFISMPDEVVKKCAIKKYKRVGILASPTSIRLGLYDEKLRNEGIELIKPRQSEEVIIEKMIRHYIGDKSNGEFRNEYIKVLTSLFERNCEAVILGCTELPLVINYEALGDKVIDSSEVLAGALVNYYYQN